MELRPATLSDQDSIWKILQQAIAQRREDGSAQWQDGYPNRQTIADDIADKNGYVMTENDAIIAYAATIFGVDPAYKAIRGKWLTEGAYAVVHRVATLNAYKGKGVATQLFRFVEDMAIGRKLFSIKVDTNFDNIPMLNLLKRLGYTYCGEVSMRGEPRKAFEKTLPGNSSGNRPGKTKGSV